MTETDQPADRVLVAVNRSTAHVRIVGRGTLKIGPALRDFFASAEGGGIRRAEIDLSACETLDSTMLGILAGLAMRLRRQGGDMAVSGLSIKTLGLFRTLGLDRLIEPMPTPADGPSGLRPLDRDSTARQADETILEAHETLVEAEASNLPKFRDVIEFMRDSVSRRQGEGSSGS